MPPKTWEISFGNNANKPKFDPNSNIKPWQMKNYQKQQPQQYNTNSNSYNNYKGNNYNNNNNRPNHYNNNNNFSSPNKYNNNNNNNNYNNRNNFQNNSQYHPKPWQQKSEDSNNGMDDSSENSQQYNKPFYPKNNYNNNSYNNNYKNQYQQQRPPTEDATPTFYSEQNLRNDIVQSIQKQVLDIPQYPFTCFQPKPEYIKAMWQLATDSRDDTISVPQAVVNVISGDISTEELRWKHYSGQTNEATFRDAYQQSKANIQDLFLTNTQNRVEEYINVWSRELSQFSSSSLPTSFAGNSFTDSSMTNPTTASFTAPLFTSQQSFASPSNSFNFPSVNPLAMNTNNPPITNSTTTNTTATIAPTISPATIAPAVTAPTTTSTPATTSTTSSINTTNAQSTPLYMLDLSQVELLPPTNPPLLEKHKQHLKGMLTEEDKQVYRSAKFEFGNIPEIAPTPDLINM